MTGVAPGGDAVPPVAAPTSRLRRHTAVMAAGTAASRLLGFVRNALLVAAVGVNMGAVNAFDVANRIPNVVFAVLASGVLNAVLVPQIVRAFTRSDGARTVDRIITVGGVLLLAITLLLTAGSWLVVAFFTPGWSPELVALAVGFSLWCIPQLFFYGMYSLLGQVLNSREQFGPFMWAPVVNNVVGIAGLVAFIATFGPQAVGPASATGLSEPWGAGKIALLAGVSTLGVAVQALVLLRPLARGGYRWRLRWRGPAGEFSSIKRVAGWTLAAVVLEQAGVVWTTRVAASASAASDYSIDVAGNAAYGYALLLYLLPHSLVTISIATALFTGMSRFAAADDMAGLRGELSRGLRLVGIFTVFATAVLLALTPAIVRLAMPTAQVPEVRSVAHVLMALAAGLVPLSAMMLVKHVYYALEDGRSVFLIHIPMTAALVAITLLGRELLGFEWWVVAIGVGVAVSNLVGVALRLAGLRRRLRGLDGRRVSLTYLKAFTAAAPAFAVGFFGLRALPDTTAATGWNGAGSAFVVCAGLGAAMLAVYGLGLWLLRVQEWRSAVRPLLRRVGIRVP